MSEMEAVGVRAAHEAAIGYQRLSDGLSAPEFFNFERWRKALLANARAIRFLEEFCDALRLKRSRQIVNRERRLHREHLRINAE